MKTLKEKIAVMQAALDGKEIEVQDKGDNSWDLIIDATRLEFNWGMVNYRIKPEPMDYEAKITELEEKLEKVYEAGINGIGHVGMANYASREREAINKLEKAMYGEEE